MPRSIAPEPAIVITGSLYLAGAAIAFFDKIAAAMTTPQPDTTFFIARSPPPIPRSPTPSASRPQRQNDTLELIASENHVSHAVLTAMGSVFTNKYAEGYPGKRYYGGCGPTDIVENIAIDRAKELFGAEHANVQPHSGSQANMSRLLRHAQAGRHDHGHGPLARRPPHARPSALVQRPRFQGRRVRRAQRR